jgi:hypothetical protein
VHLDWQFDHIDPLPANPLNEVLAGLRGQCPVVHSTQHGGFTAALTYDSIKQILGDHGTYSSTDGIAIPRLTMTGKPPVDLTRTAVAQYDDTLRMLVRHRIKELIAQGSADLGGWTGCSSRPAPGIARRATWRCASSRTTSRASSKGNERRARTPSRWRSRMGPSTDGR